MVKNLMSLILLLFTLFIFGISNPAFAADLDHGIGVFTANCASCHAGGKNVVNGAKTLKKEDLDKYGMHDLVAIKTQIIKGKNAMPAFGGRLSDADIEDVASYVLAQADKGW